MFQHHIWIRIVGLVLVFLVLVMSPVAHVGAQTAQCVELLPQPWYLQGNDGASELYQPIPPDIFADKQFIRVSYDLHGLETLGGDASALIVDQNGWQYISLSDYGQNGLDGSQTVDIPLSHFSGLDPSLPVGLLHTRFWYGSAFTVDILSVQACSAFQPATPTPTLAPTFTAAPTETQMPPTPTSTLTPTATAAPTATATATDVPPAISEMPPGGIQLLPQPWLMTGNDGAVESYQSIPEYALQGKDTLRIDYDLHGLQALGNDASAVIFDQNGWRYVSLSDYGTNGLDGIQTVDIPLSDFTDLDTNQPVGLLHTRFWANGSYAVDILSVIAYSSQQGAETDTPTVSPTTVPSIVPSTPTATTSAATALPNPLPSPWANTDVGAPFVQGSSYSSNGGFAINGAGNDIWENTDEFQYVYQVIDGDVQITARVTSQTHTDDWAKAGVIIKQSTGALSPYALMAITPGNGYAFQTGFVNSTHGPSYTLPTWVRLVRTGDTIDGYVSPDGVGWIRLGTTTITMSETFTVGLFVTSHNGSQLSSATFDSVSVISGAVQPQPTTTPTSVPIVVTAQPIVYPAACTSGERGPGNLPPDNYPIGSLTPEQQQWLWEVFGHGDEGVVPVGYGGEECSPGVNVPPACFSNARGPGNIPPDNYSIESLTPEQHQWLWEIFGHADEGVVPVGYGGEDCSPGVNISPACYSGAVGPGGIRPGNYPIESLTPEQHQWLWEIFGHADEGVVPVGYGGEGCPDGLNPPDPISTPSYSPVCFSGVTGPGGIRPDNYVIQTLTSDQQRWLWEVFGHGDEGDVPVGYGGEDCPGDPVLVPTPSGGDTDIPEDPGSSTPLSTTSVRVTASPSLNIRGGPGTQYPIVGRAANGGYFELLAPPDSGWYLIHFGSEQGWVSGQYIEIHHQDNDGQTPSIPSPSLGQCSALDWFIAYENVYDFAHDEWVDKWVLAVVTPRGRKPQNLQIYFEGLEVPNADNAVSTTNQIYDWSDNTFSFWYYGISTEWRLIQPGHRDFWDSSQWFVFHDCLA